MARTPSNMKELGSAAPEFSLTDVISNSKVELRSHKGQIATVIMFICNHCPYVKHVNKELSQLAKDYTGKGISFIAINSNDVKNYPDDSPENMRITAQTEDYQFPYLFDETQDVAKAYQAACTPDFFIYDANLTLVYRGQLDDSRPGNQIPVSGISIRNALDCLLNALPVSTEQKPSLGCNIKWKE
ncbi:MULTISPECIES: thioredoxin family protein [Legionella]|uniref:Thioredoxin family protein n=1 Tax=Legionella quinlivanii TaxID=45073 RepID=A0A364LIZ8_9GAMM|nr:MULTISPECIES: thioredoxin family protein [Legionella]MCE3044892.1 thioredoxin family protein [Legionella sp. 16cNR16C]RAP36379.1 thioredoxin family protein [Legionella quinlivanii]